MEPRGEAMDNATPTAQKKPDRSPKKKEEPEDLIEFRLQYFKFPLKVTFEEDSDYAPDDNAPVEALKNQMPKLQEDWFDHYFRCPTSTSLDTIRKLLVQKFNLGEKYEVIFVNKYIYQELHMSMKLAEVAIEAGWRHRRPLKLMFTLKKKVVIEPMPQLEQEDNENVETVPNEAETPPPPMLTPSVPIPSTIPQQKPQLVMIPPQLPISAPAPQKRRRTSQNQTSPQAMPQFRVAPPQVMNNQMFTPFTQQQMQEMFTRQRIVFQHPNQAVIAQPQDSRRDQSAGYGRLMQQQQQIQQQFLIQQHQLHQQQQMQQMHPQMQTQMHLFPVQMARSVDMGPAAKMPRMMPVALQQQMLKFQQHQQQQQQLKQAEAAKNAAFASPPSISSAEVKPSPSLSVAPSTSVVSPAPPVLSKAPSPPSPAQQPGPSQVTPSPPSLSSESPSVKTVVKETPKCAPPVERLKPYHAEVVVQPIMCVNRPPPPPQPQVATVAPTTFDDSKIDLGTMAKMKKQSLGRILKDSFLKPSPSSRPSVPSASPTVPPSLASPTASAMMEGIHAKNVNGEVQISAPANAIDFLQHKAIVSTM